jgi:hypothetical protein
MPQGRLRSVRPDPPAVVNPLRAPAGPPLVPAVIAGLVAFWRLMRSADGPPRKRRRGRWDWLRPDAPVPFGSVGDGGGATPCPLRGRGHICSADGGGCPNADGFVGTGVQFEGRPLPTQRARPLLPTADVLLPTRRRFTPSRAR